MGKAELNREWLEELPRRLEFLPETVMGKDRVVLDPNTGKQASMDARQVWRDRRVARCKEQWWAACERLREGTGLPNELQPIDCIAFVASLEEWNEATGMAIRRDLRVA
jgi:hypothetical protein